MVNPGKSSVPPEQPLLNSSGRIPFERVIPVRLLVDSEYAQKDRQVLAFEYPKPMILTHQSLGCEYSTASMVLAFGRTLYHHWPAANYPWSFRVWRGKGQPSPNQLACKLLASVPKSAGQRQNGNCSSRTPNLAPAEFLNAVRRRNWRVVVGLRNSRLLQDGRKLKDLPGKAKRGLQIYLKDIDYPLTISWFWLKRAGNKRELRFVASTHPYSGVYLVRLGRKRWAIEGFFKTAKHQFGLHCFGQGTKIGVYRWLILSLIAYLLAHWVDLWAWPPVLDWKATARLTLEKLLPAVLWSQMLRQIRQNADVAAHYGFEIVINSLHNKAYKDWCKI